MLDRCYGPVRLRDSTILSPITGQLPATRARRARRHYRAGLLIGSPPITMHKAARRHLADTNMHRMRAYGTRTIHQNVVYCGPVWRLVHCVNNPIYVRNRRTTAPISTRTPA